LGNSLLPNCGIPWEHNLAILSKCKRHDEALYYVQATNTYGWSRNVLVHQIESGLWQREGQAITNFAQTLPAVQSARSNVLSNRYALSKLEEHLALGGLRIAGEAVFFKSHVAELLDIDERTIDRYLASHEVELKQNGYRIFKGKSLRDLKLAQVGDIHVADLIGAKVPALGVFSFRAVLNVAMLVTESERAKAIRSRMLDIVLDVVAERTGGHTRFINQRDQD
jgi:predicted nuclease of restriction endonuclease-like (RecB) superfamily